MPPPPPPPKNDITIANDVQLGNPIPVTNPSKAASKGSKKPTVNLDAGGKNGGRNEEQQAKLKKAVRNASAAKGKGKESLNVNQNSTVKTALYTLSALSFLYLAYLLSPSPSLSISSLTNHLPIPPSLYPYLPGFLIPPAVNHPKSSSKPKSNTKPTSKSKPLPKTNPSRMGNDSPLRYPHLPFPWPVWAGPREAVNDSLPGVKNASELRMGMGMGMGEEGERRGQVREAFAHSWKAYEEHAWGHDEYHPLSQSGSYLTSAQQPMGYMIVDSLDSLLLMGFEEEYKRAREWIRGNLRKGFEVEGKVNGFETIIRILGGLLSAYYLTSTHANPLYHPDSALYLELSIDLADRLLPLFSSPSGIPYSFIDLATSTPYPDADNRGLSSLAEAGTVQLEFKYLSWVTGDEKYWMVVEKVMAVLQGQMPSEGIAPILIDPQSGRFVPFAIRLGSRGDSYYEYLLKQWLQTNRTEPVYRQMYDQAMKGVEKLLIYRSPKQGLIHTVELEPRRAQDGSTAWRVEGKQDHLVCFLGGSLLLGVASSFPDQQPVWTEMDDSNSLDYITGKGLIRTCVETYVGSATGLAPEIAMLRGPDEMMAKAGIKDWYVKKGMNDEIILDNRNILRPETVESLFLAYRTTGDQIYRDQGWAIFQQFQKYCRVPGGGYAGIVNTDDANTEQIDKMETFWLSETLKYLYLLFSDGDTIPLDKNIFNTEAHILPVFTPERFSVFGQKHIFE